MGGSGFVASLKVSSAVSSGIPDIAQPFRSILVSTVPGSSVFVLQERQEECRQEERRAEGGGGTHLQAAPAILSSVQESPMKCVREGLDQQLAQAVRFVVGVRPLKLQVLPRYFPCEVARRRARSEARTTARRRRLTLGAQRRRVDDMPVAVHCRQEQLRQREGRQNVHREGELVPIRRGLPLLVREDPGVVDEHVQPINLLLDLVGHSSHLRKTDRG